MMNCTCSFFLSVQQTRFKVDSLIHPEFDLNISGLVVFVVVDVFKFYKVYVMLNRCKEFQIAVRNLKQKQITNTTFLDDTSSQIYYFYAPSLQ